jgi:hypothetical protein
MTAIVEDQKAKYARFFWPILRGIALIVALWAFIADLQGFMYGEDGEQPCWLAGVRSCLIHLVSDDP